MRRSKNHELPARLCIGLAILALGLGSGAALAGDLYAVSGAGTGTASSLYTVDVGTGAATLVGPTGVEHIVGIDFDPTSGVLYGSQSAGFGSSPGGLYTLDISSGAATPVGAPHDCSTPDVSFRADGTLYAWVEECGGSSLDDLGTIDLTTGAVTIVGPGTGTAGTGLAFDLADVLHMSQFLGSHHTVDPGTGFATPAGSFTGDCGGIGHNALAVDPMTGKAYGISRDGGSDTWLCEVDLTANTATKIGLMGVGRIAALAFTAGCDDSDPIAWWQFDEDSDQDGASGSVVLDSTANDNDGHLWNGASRVPSPFGVTAALLDGVNDYVNVGSKSILDNLQAFTYSAWVYPTAFGDREIFSKRNSTKELRFTGAGTLRGCVIASGGNACSNSVGTVPLGTWTHVAMTHDHAGDRKVHLYIDGVEVGYASQSTASGMMASEAPNPQLLGRRQNKSRPFAGMLDEMMIFDRALPACRIAALAASDACAGNPLWQPVDCTTPAWVWSSDRTYTTVPSADANDVLWGGCQHVSDAGNTCSLDGTGWVSTTVFTMAGCNTSWYHLGGRYTGNCGGHDGDQVRLLTMDPQGCFDYTP